MRGDDGCAPCRAADRAVHPHVRGDDATPAPPSDEELGSPPRAWGRLRRLPHRQRPARFTPTCVGTTAARPSSCHRASVHPHVRGDDMTQYTNHTQRTGSPPRAWGRLRTAPPGRCPWPVHPHVRGDDCLRVEKSHAPPGSPPRAWGRRRVDRRGQERRRFTPTCVGTTRASACASAPWPVHPHVRGDDGNQMQPAITLTGSPPRAWGRQPRPPADRRGTRFTPTCVGTTHTTASSCPGKSVHPHVRGDDAGSATSSTKFAGSPPRAWGRHDQIRYMVNRFRFTPTCVGTTLAGVRLALPPAVHPHVRGDDVMLVGTLPTGYGSPPRAWGRRSRST